MRAPSKWRTLALAYFAVQAIAVIAWWAMLLILPSTRDAFAIRGASFAALGAFAPGDLALIALGSAAVAVGRERAWTVNAAWLASGALIYATFYAVIAALTDVSPLLGAMLMLPAAVASVAGSAILTRDANADRIPPGSSA